MTVRSLAARMALTEPALYRHFESKTDILLAILSRFGEGVQNMVPEGIRRKRTRTNPLDVFLRLVLSRFEERPEVASVIFAEEIFRNEPRLEEKVKKIMVRHKKVLVALLERGQSEGWVRSDLSARDLAVVVQGALRLLVSRWRMDGFGPSLVRDGRRLSKTLRTLLS